jgi:chlorobactene glucosyltransferase
VSLNLIDNLQWAILQFLILLAAVAAVNWFSLRRLESYKPSGRRPVISVLVPARDEAHNIQACLESLLHQDYPEYEVLVLDDESQDGTAEILKRLAHTYPGLKVLSGASKPQGWVGKQWACHQLSQAARGELLLFTDADTRYQRGTLSSAAGAMEALQLDFLTGMPRQLTGSWQERLTIPLLAFLIFALLPVPLARRLPFAWLSAGIGQFLLFRREAYERLGGHAAVRATSIEDFAFARLSKRASLRWDFMDLTGRVRCRMYPEAGQVFAGIGKNLFAVFNHQPLPYLLAWGWLLVVFTFPALGLAAAATGRPLDGFSIHLGAASLGLALVLWMASSLRFRLPVGAAFFFPLTAIWTFLMAAWSIFVYFSGQKVEWKGRELPRDRRAT